jgi:F-type H+-transporting ATPase subunit delta
VKDLTIARAYAGALFEVGERHGEAEAYSAPFRVLAEMFSSDFRTRRFFDTPRITAEARRSAVRKALEGRVPEHFLHFVLLVLDKERQKLLPQIAEAYQALVDENSGRHRAYVTLARRPDAAMESLITERLSRLFGEAMEPQITVNPAIVGGLIVRYGDQYLDASLRRQLVALRRELNHAHLPAKPAATA